LYIIHSPPIQRYVAGAFTRVHGNVMRSFNFGRYNEDNQWEALPSVGLGLVSDLDTMVDLQYDDKRKILAYVKTMVCPEDRDYIILGGHFAFVNNETVKSDVFNHTYVNVSNIVLFNVKQKKFIPIETQVSIDDKTGARYSSRFGVSVTSTNSLAIVNSLSCVNDRVCSRVYMGGLFDYAFGVTAGNIVGFDLSYPDITNSSVSRTYALAHNVAVIGQSRVGVDGIVMAVQVLTENRIIFGGAFPSIAGNFAASLGVWNGLNSMFFLVFFSHISFSTLTLSLSLSLSHTHTHIHTSTGTKNDTYANYGCVPTLGKEIAEESFGECVVPAVCCHGIGGFVFALERISNESVMVGGEFEMSFSHPHAKNLVQIVYNSAIPTDASGWIFPNTSATDSVSIQASSAVNSLHCAVRDSDGTCLVSFSLSLSRSL